MRRLARRMRRTATRRMATRCMATRRTATRRSTRRSKLVQHHVEYDRSSADYRILKSDVLPEVPDVAAVPSAPASLRAGLPAAPLTKSAAPSIEPDAPSIEPAAP